MENRISISTGPGKTIAIYCQISRLIALKKLAEKRQVSQKRISTSALVSEAIDDLLRRENIPI
jgi:hypothetical protein